MLISLVLHCLRVQSYALFSKPPNIRHHFFRHAALFLGFFLFELAVDGFEAEVNCFLEGVGGLRRHYVFVLGHGHFYGDFLVHCRFGLHDFEGDVDVGYCCVMTGEFFGFFVDEGRETVSDVKVDCLDSDFHGCPPFFVHAGVRVDNYVEVRLSIYAYISVSCRVIRAPAGSLRR